MTGQTSLRSMHTNTPTHLLPSTLSAMGPRRPYDVDTIPPYETLAHYPELAIPTRLIRPTQSKLIIERLLALHRGEPAEGPDPCVHLVLVERHPLRPQRTSPLGSSVDARRINPSRPSLRAMSDYPVEGPDAQLIPFHHKPCDALLVSGGKVRASPTDIAHAQRMIMASGKLAQPGDTIWCEMCCELVREGSIQPRGGWM